MKSLERKKTAGGLPQASGVSESTMDGQEFRERIALKAYELYEKRGRTHGCDVEDWLEAEKLVSAEVKEERRPKGKISRERSKTLKTG